MPGPASSDGRALALKKFSSVGTPVRDSAQDFQVQNIFRIKYKAWPDLRKNVVDHTTYYNENTVVKPSKPSERKGT